MVTFVKIYFIVILPLIKLTVNRFNIKVYIYFRKIHNSSKNYFKASYNLNKNDEVRDLFIFKQTY